MRIEISEQAEADLEALPENVRLSVLNKMRLLPVYYREHRLTRVQIHNDWGQYAYRCGKQRIFLDVVDNVLTINTVRYRKIAYNPRRRGNARNKG